MLKNTPERYGSMARALHWLTAVVIITLIGVGIYMTGLAEEDPARRNIYDLHKSFGVLAGLLVVLRFAWIAVDRPPALPAALAPKERKLTLAVRLALYALMVILPVSGYLMSTAAGYPVPFFGLFDMPALVGESKALAGFAHEVHEYLGWGIGLVVLLHVAGALKHRVLDRGGEKDILQRML